MRISHLLLAVALPLAAESVTAQSRPVRPPPKIKYFAAGDWYLSPRLILAGVQGSATSYGLSLEKAIGVEDDDGGVWGVSVDVDHYSYTANYGYGISSTTNETPIGVMANYHFALDNPRLDPYLGGGLGYYIVSTSVNSGDGNMNVGRASTTFFQAQAGIRYFITDALALGAHAGVGIGNLGVSATFRF